VSSPTLTETEQANAMAAMHFLRTRLGSWKLLASALRFAPTSIRYVKKRRRRVSINMAYKVAGLAGVPFDDVVKGRWPAKGMCPHCGRVG